MTRGEMLRVLVSERLTAAAEEIFALVEKTIAEYEAELSRSKEENQRKQQLLEQALDQQAPDLSTDVESQTERPRGLHPLVKIEDTNEGAPVIFSRSDHPTEAVVLTEVDDGCSEIDDEVSEVAAFTPTEMEALTEAVLQKTTDPSTAGVPNSDEADSQAVPATKRKRGRPRRVTAPTDGPRRRPQPFAQTRASPEETGILQRQRPGPQGLVLFSEAETQTEGDRALILNLPQTPEQSNCPKSNLQIEMQTFVSPETPGGGAEQQAPDACLKEKADFRCSYCDRVFTRLHHLERHVLIHTGERPFSCSVCAKSFRLKQHLASHVAIHKDERLFSCPVCVKKFKRRDNLGRHIMVHTGIKPFQCPDCHVQFALKKNLVRHMIVHNRDVTYSCQVCKMVFSSPYYFQQHTKTHRRRK